MEDYFIFHSVNRWLPQTANWIHEQCCLWPMERQLVLANQLVEPTPNEPQVKFRNAFNPTLFNRIQSKILPNNNDLFRALEIAKQKDFFKVLISHFGNRGFMDLGLKADKHIVRFYGYDLHRLPHEDPKWLDNYARLFDQANRFWVEGPYMRDQLVDMGLASEKIEVLPIGTNLQGVEHQIRKQQETYHILIAGSFKEKKGICDALEACALLIQKGYSIRIHLVGDEVNATANDRRYTQKVRQFIQSPGLQPHLTHYGLISRDKLLRVAQNCQLGLLPSKWSQDRDCEGGYPVLFLDVMATGLPIISTRHCDIPSVINESCGWLCEEDNVYALVHEMENVLSGEDLSEKSLAARKRVEDHFSWQVLKPTYENALMNA